MELTKDTLMIGMLKSLENAGELLIDAKLLKDNNRMSRAYTLYQLSIEEVGKCLQCMSTLLFDEFNDPKAIKELMNYFGYKGHKLKLKKSYTMDIFIAKALHSNDPDKSLDFLVKSLNEKEEVDQLNNLKNFSLYTSLCKGEFVNPSQVITKKLLEGVEFRALSRFGITKGMISMIQKNVDAIREEAKSFTWTDEKVQNAMREFFRDLNAKEETDFNFQPEQQQE